MRELLLGLTLCGCLAAQSATVKPDDLCTVEGRAVNSATGAPLHDVKLKLRLSNGPKSGGVSFVTLTDDEGNFAFARIEPGTYLFSAERPGYLTANFGVQRSGAQPVPFTLKAADKRTGIEFRLKQQGVIVGRVLNKDDIYDSTLVSVARTTYRDGKKQVNTVGGGKFLNDAGEFRLAGLEPGKYYVVAEPLVPRGSAPVDLSGRPKVTYQRTYSFSTTDPSGAKAWEVAPGVTVTGADISVAGGQPFTIRGRIVNQTGAPLRDLSLTLVSPGISMVRGSMPEGAFELAGLVQGAYTVVASGADPQGLLQEVRHSLTLRDSVDNVELVFRPGTSVAGRVSAQEGALPKGVKVTFNLQDAFYDVRSQRTAPVGEDGAFLVPAVGADKYFVSVTGMPANYYVKAIRLGKEDVLHNGIDLAPKPEFPLEVVISPKAATVAGTVADPQGAPKPGAIVVLVPQNAKERERIEWYRTATADTEGKFSIAGIPPGEYKLFAWEDIETNAWMDADILKPLEARATPLTLAEGVTEKVELKPFPAQ